MNAPRKPRVLLLEVEIRSSERTGRAWYSAWLGRARLVGFDTEQPNTRGHRVIQFYAEEPEPRDATPALRQRAPQREAPSAGPGVPSATGARPDGAERPAYADTTHSNPASHLARAAQE